MKNHVASCGHGCQVTTWTRGGAVGNVRHVATTARRERLAIAIKRAGTTPYAVAKALRPEAKRVDTGRVTKSLSGDRGKAGFGNDLMILARILDVDPVWLQEGGDYIKPGELAPPYVPPHPVEERDWKSVAYRLVAHPKRWGKDVLDAFAAAPVVAYKGDRSLDRILDEIQAAIEAKRAVRR
jgi:hypothetical protein